MNLLPILFSVLAYLIQDIPEKRFFASKSPAIAAPIMVCDRRSDSLELVKFYNATGGPNWLNKWDLLKPMNTWYGITLNAQGCVICIDMDGNPNCLGDNLETNNLTGSLIQLNFENLYFLNLNNNKISGSIPNFNLPSLHTLVLGSNNLSGVIPNFNQLPNLVILALHINQLDGLIPNFNSLPNLQVLLLYSNNLNGQIPNFNNLPNLVNLNLVNNQLTGQIPNFDKLTNLLELGLSTNQLTGTIPDLNKIPKLQNLSLSNNQLIGNIPNFSSIASLKLLDLNQNKLIGNIPNFSNLLNLNSLLLNNNSLTGSIPNFNLPNLVQLSLYNNQLTGTIPDFNNLPSLSNLWLNNNKLSGMFPSCAKIPKLRELRLSNNQLSGNILYPIFSNSEIIYYHVFSNLLTFTDIINGLEFIDNLITIRNNSPGGLIFTPQQKIYTDTTITISPNTNYTLDLLIDDTVTTSNYTWFKNGVLYKTIKGSNKLPFSPFTAADAGTYTVRITNPLAPQLTLESHPIRLVAGPQLVCDRRSDSLELVRFYNATGGPNWWKKWDLKKPMDTWWGITLTGNCVEEINQSDTSGTTCCITCCSGNNLIGTIPFLNLPSLKQLNLFNNTLSGTIPDFDKLPILEVLDLGTNPLQGPIPNFRFLSNLKHFKARLCFSLDGNIPNFSNLPNLESIYLGYNNLSGSIPNFSNLPKLKYLELHLNSLSGSIPNFTNLPSLEVLDLQGNQLISSIPNFDKLANLQSLKLAANQLSGRIPDFNKLQNLVNLDLISNQLSGPLPSLDSTPDLRNLFLSNNQLSGAIPNFNRLTSLNYLWLDSNQLTGTIPNFNMPKINEFKFHTNQLVGGIPNFNNPKDLYWLWVDNNKLSELVQDFTKILPGLSLFYANNNNYTFSDLIKSTLANKTHIDGLPHKSLNPADSFRYAPQQKIYSDTSITIPPCTDYTLDLKIDDTVTTSTYAWFKDGAPDTIIKGSNKRRFINFNSAHVGTYTVKITNPLAPQLTLESHPIRLSVGTGLCCDRRSDSLELVKFYNSTGGQSNWWKKWDLSKPMNTWWGIELNPSGCVKTLRVSDTTLNGFTACCSGNNLVGTFPDIYLPELEVFHCQNNLGITGQIPNFNFPNLVELTVHTCMLSGGIPNFDKLPKLKILNLHRNKLTGPIPDFRHLPNLENLNLSVNALSGSIPDFPSFQNLKFLELYNNMLSGAIPDFSQMPNLTLLYLQSNQLSGPIPNFRNLGSLNCMGLDNNMLSGPLPNFEFLKKLQVVGISNNMLSGFLPDYSSFNPSLATLTIDGNAYTFDGLVSNTIRVRDITQRITSPDCPGSPEIFVYYPQKKIYSDTTITIIACSDYILDLKIDDTVTTSTYTWFKNGSQDTIIIGSNKRRFTNFNSVQAGTYTVKITNPLAPQLTLESHPIRLVSSGVVTNINNPRDTSLTCGLSFRLPVITGQNLGSDAAYFTGPGRTGTRYASGQSITADATLYVHTTSGGCFDEDTFSIRFTIPVLIARPDTVRTKAGKSVPFGVLDNDNIPAGLPTQVTIDNPSNGSILYSNSSGRGTYTPKIGFVGTEVLNYTVCIVDCPASCKSSILTLIVEGPCGDRNSIVLPNVIFPTGNGDNRYFIVEAISECPDAWGPKPHKLQVFNRWGNEVYRNDNYLNDWEGTNTSGQPLPEGTYYYLLDLGSVAAPVKGYVVIVR